MRYKGHSAEVDFLNILGLVADRKMTLRNPRLVSQ